MPRQSNLLGEGEVRFFARLSGCRLCFNLLLHFSKTNRETLSWLFMLRFPFSPIAPPAFLGGLSGGICSVESQLHKDGASLPRRASLGHTGLSLPGCVTVSLDRLFPSLCRGDELAEVENADCREKRVFVA